MTKKRIKNFLNVEIFHEEQQLLQIYKFTVGTLMDTENNLMWPKK